MGFFGRKKFQVDDTPEPTPAPVSANQLAATAGQESNPRSGVPRGGNSASKPQAALPEPTPKYGVDDAIELMRTLPHDNIELVVQVVLHTLKSMDIEVGDIVADADSKQQGLRERVATLQSEIADFKTKIAGREKEIQQLEADHAETGIVKDRLTLAQRLVTNSPPSPAPLTSTRRAPASPKSPTSGPSSLASSGPGSTSVGGLLGGSSPLSTSTSTASTPSPSTSIGSSLSRPGLGGGLKSTRKTGTARLGGVGRSSSTSKTKMPSLKAPPSTRQPTPPRPAATTAKGTEPAKASAGSALLGEPLFSEPEVETPDASPDLAFAIPEPSFPPPDELKDEAVEVAAEISFAVPGDDSDAQDLDDDLVLSSQESEPDDETAPAAIEAAEEAEDKSPSKKGKSKGRKRSGTKNKKKS